MEERERRYVERVATQLAAQGMPRMAGRIWGYLLVCDPPDQTAAQVADALHVSRGSVSGMARLLESAGLIVRATRPGERREWLSVPHDFASTILRGRVAATTSWRELTDEGLALLADRPAAVRARLHDLRDVYAFMERELPALLERYRSQRAEDEGGAA
jgi:DNA-binding transcriptional regulator GbsR (MarR family)